MKRFIYNARHNSEQLKRIKHLKRIVCDFQTVSNHFPEVLDQLKFSTDLEPRAINKQFNLEENS